MFSYARFSCRLAEIRVTYHKGYCWLDEGENVFGKYVATSQVWRENHN